MADKTVSNIGVGPVRSVNEQLRRLEKCSQIIHLHGRWILSKWCHDFCRGRRWLVLAFLARNARNARAAFWVRVSDGIEWRHLPVSVVGLVQYWRCEIFGRARLSTCSLRRLVWVVADIEPNQYQPPVIGPNQVGCMGRRVKVFPASWTGSMALLLALLIPL